MDTILVLLGLVALAIPVAVIGLLIGHSRLRRRLAALERQVAAMAKTPMPDPVAQALVPVLAETLQAEPERLLAEPEEGLAANLSPVEPAPNVAPSPWDRATKPAGQTADGAPPAMVAQAAPDQDRPLVLRADRVLALTEWLRPNTSRLPGRSVV